METKSKSTPLITYIHEISGQLRRQNIIESEHAYAKFWNRHPDPTNKSRPARFLFMQSFARWSSNEGENEIIDVDSVDDKLFLTSNPASNPLVAEVTALTKGQVTITEEFAVTDSAPNKSTWSNLAQRIWAKALNILYTDRLIRLSIEGTPNEIITKKMISHKCANKFRHLFASLAFWDPSILSWLHATLLEHVSGQYLTAYHESMQLLRSKLSTLIDRFYLPPVHNDPIRSRNKGPMPDPIQNVLNNHKPKRIKNCPLFILVPNGPQPSSSIQRLKHWQLLFASLGKIISINYRPTLRVKDCLNEIMIGVRDKIKECRTSFTEGRPIILVGFGHSSLIATHVALDPTCKVTATICLGFPLAGVNGFRGDLDDPLLDTTVPTLFVIGQNATLSSIDDVEDFRERITKTETGLVVVGGANDHLVVSQTKQRFTGITQAIVDRCISDEIYDFINFVMNPHFVPSENKYVSAAAKSLSKTPPGAKGEKTTKSKSKSEKQAAKDIENTNLTKRLGILSSDSDIIAQPTSGVDTSTTLGSSADTVTNNSVISGIGVGSSITNLENAGTTAVGPLEDATTTLDQKTKIPSDNNYVPAAVKKLSKTPPRGKEEKTTKSKSKKKTEKQAIKETINVNLTKKIGIFSSDPEIITQSSIGVDTSTSLSSSVDIVSNNTVFSGLGVGLSENESTSASRPSEDATITPDQKTKVPSENNDASVKKLSKKTPKSKEEKSTKSKSKKKTEKQATKETPNTNFTRKLGILSGDPDMITQSSVGVDTSTALNSPVSVDTIANNSVSSGIGVGSSITNLENEGTTAAGPLEDTTITPNQKTKVPSENNYVSATLKKLPKDKEENSTKKSKRKKEKQTAKVGCNKKKRLQ